MRDKERILTHIISCLYPKYILNMKTNSLNEFENCTSRNIKVGDMVLAVTSGVHNFTVGYAEQIINEGNIVVKEIGGKRTCNISNEMFYKISPELLSKTELLEGLQYKIYRKVSKALSELSYSKRFHSINFENNTCTVNLRRIFDNEICMTFSFSFTDKITQKEITQIVDKVLEKDNTD